MVQIDLSIEGERYGKSEFHRERRIQMLRTMSSASIRDRGQPSSSQGTDGQHNYMDPELYRAAAAAEDDADGFLDLLERISSEKNLTLAAIFDQVTPLKNTFLHVAVASGSSNMVELIVDQYPWLAAKANSNGDTALHLAAKSGDVHIVSSINARLFGFPTTGPKSGKSRVSGTGDDDLPLRKQNKQGNTAVHVALKNGHQSVALILYLEDPQVRYCLNQERESPLYLAAEAGYISFVRTMLNDPVSGENPNRELKGKPPVHAPNSDEYPEQKLEGKSAFHAATKNRNLDILDIMLEKYPSLIYSKDEEERTPLHCAASIGHLKGVRYLLGKYALGCFERDKKGFSPIHMASLKGHINVMRELLRHCPYSRELLNDNDQNILHTAAMNGKYDVVSYILKTPKLKELINDRDKDGNTPLHLATMHWHPRIVSVLTWDKKVDLKLVNSKGLTAFDIAEYYMETSAPFRKRLTWTALRTAGAPRGTRHKSLSAIRQSSMQLEPTKVDGYKDRVNTLLLVATLVATVTFAAGFTMPGGNNDSEPDQGMATMVRHKKFQVFIFCDTIAMYSSIIVAVSLIWAQLCDLKLVLNALNLALPLLGISLATMSIAFMAGLSLVVSNLNWLSNTVLIMGFIFLVIMAVLFLPLYSPTSSRFCIFRYISLFSFHLLMLATGSYSTDDILEM